MNELSCDSINNGICFNNCKTTSITYCTLTNNANGLGWPNVIENYDGSPIDWGKFFESREREQKLIAEGNPRKECAGCNQIFLGPKVSHRKIRYILLSTWQVCNSDCLYCLGHAPVVSPDDPNYAEHYDRWIEPYDIFAIVKDMVEKDILDKDAIIDFAGGEPTLYPRFNELLKFFVDNGYKNIIIHTNAIQYAPAIEYGIKNDAVSLLISIDAGTKGMHEKVKRVKSYDAVWKIFKKYSSARGKDFSCNLGTKYVVMPGVNDSKREIEIWLKESKKHGATKVVLNVYNQLLNELNYKEDILKKLIDLSEFAIEKAKKLNIPLQLYPNYSAVYVAANRVCSAVN